MEDKSKPKFALYDKVYTLCDGCMIVSTVEDIQPSTVDYQYTLTTADGERFTAYEQAITLMQKSNPPFQFFEVVSIRTQLPELSEVNGASGYITGMSLDIPSGVWGFSVMIENTNWFFTQNDIEATGTFIPAQLRDEIIGGIEHVYVKMEE